MIDNVQHIPEKWGNIPAAYRGMDFENWRGVAPVKDWKVEDHWAVTFIGPPGTGKTHAAVALLKRCGMNWKRPVSYTEYDGTVVQIGWNYPGTFVSAREWINRMREGVQSGMTGAIRKRVVELNLLLLDDFPVDNVTPFAAENIDYLIGERHANRRPTIFTTNARNLGVIARVYGDRIASRLAEGVITVRDGKDQRQG